MSSIAAAAVKHIQKERLFTNKDLFVLFLPLIAEQILSFFVGLADSLMASLIGEVAVSGVSLVDMLAELLISIFTALAAGGAVVMGQYIGAGKRDGARCAATQTVGFVGCIGIIIMMVVYLFKNIILRGLFSQIEADVYACANTYLLITAASFPFIAVYNAGAAIFRSRGNSALSMRIMLCMNLLNIFGNSVFIFIFHTGVEGLAIPTLVSRVGAAMIILYFCTKKGGVIDLTGFICFDKNEIKRILRIGIPYSFENGMFYFGRLLLASLVSGFGTASIAANSVGGTLTSFQVLPGTAIGMGLSVVISRCAGAADYTQARYYTKKIIGIIYVVHIFSAAVIIAALPCIMDVYDFSREATELVYRIVISHGIVMAFIWPLGNSLPVVFRASSDAAFPMKVCILTMIFCRIALSYVFVYAFNLNMIAVWIAIYCDWLVKGIIFVWRYFSDKWTKCGNK